MRTYTDAANDLTFWSERITTLAGVAGRSVVFEKVRVTATDTVTGHRIANIAQVLQFKEILGVTSGLKFTGSAIEALAGNSLPVFTYSVSAPTNDALKYLQLATSEVDLTVGEYYEFIIMGTV